MKIGKFTLLVESWKFLEGFVQLINLWSLYSAAIVCNFPPPPLAPGFSCASAVKPPTRFTISPQPIDRNLINGLRTFDSKREWTAGRRESIFSQRREFCSSWRIKRMENEFSFCAKVIHFHFSFALFAESLWITFDYNQYFTLSRTTKPINLREADPWLISIILHSLNVSIMRDCSERSAVDCRNESYLFSTALLLCQPQKRSSSVATKETTEAAWA